MVADALFWAAGGITRWRPCGLDFGWLAARGRCCSAESFAKHQAVAVLEARSSVGARPGAAGAEQLLVSGDEYPVLQWTTRDALRAELTGKGAAALAAWDAAAVSC